MWRLVCFSLFAAVTCTTSNYIRTTKYDDELIVRCDNVSRVQYQAILDRPGMDVWSAANGGSRLDVRVARDDVMQLKQLELYCTTLHDSVEQLVEKFESSLSVKQEWFEDYHTYEDTINWYEEIATQYSELVEYVPSIGKSLEGRDMPAVHITANKETETFKIYFQCQIHAREWITGAVCGYIVNYLLENYGKDNAVTELLDSLEFIFIPFVNPDGYVYSWTEDRLWRKNRRPGDPCDGVDLNRNYNDHWGGDGSSGNPCSETYRGSSAASEPETQNTVDYFKSHSPIIGAIDWHSYSQLILRPYGWTNADSPDEAQLKEIGDVMSEVIFEVHDEYYESQKSIGLYPTTGSASDWLYSDDANVNNGEYRAAAFTFELRDDGQYGFLLPPDEIIPNGEEMIPAVIYFASSILKEPLKKF